MSFQSLCTEPKSVYHRSATKEIIFLLHLTKRSDGVNSYINRLSVAFFFAKEKNDRMKLSSLIKYRINERNIIHSLPFQQENFGIYNTIFPRELENVF